ncbi:hypothetical protein [Brevibacterium antiquum]|uniref:hypothetical protein n=1 Tax=Brevibacterium antiquum TaxID=234835 RepID=UPI0018DF4F94|nr:hypothetical protein [Brevibacterium antiquum]
MAVSQSGLGRGAGAAILAIVLAQWFGTSLWFSPAAPSTASHHGSGRHRRSSGD